MDGIDPTTEQLQEKVEPIALDRIDPSPTNPRKRFDQAKLQELADSIRGKGLIAPIVVRPVGDRFETVVGERRCRASNLAGCTTILALVRHLTDREVKEIQLEENGQREDVHPLEEADAYQNLQEEGAPVEELAARTGKTIAYVRQRLQYCALCTEAREAFLDGDLTAATALLVARIPSPKLQADAVREITRRDQHDDVMTPGEAGHHIRGRYMLQLAGAPFDRGDATLVEGVPACTTCPKRTGAQPELFADVKSPDTCTDPNCFSAKKDADWKRRTVVAKKEGKAVLPAAEAKQVFGYSGRLTHNSEYVDLAEKPYEYGNQGKKTLKTLFGKTNLPAVTVARDADGGVHELVKKADLGKALKAAGIEKKPAASSVSDDERKLREKQVLRRATLVRALASLVTAVEAVKPDLAFWRFLLALFIEHHAAHDCTTVVSKRRELDSNGSKISLEHGLTGLAEGMKEGQLRGLLVELLCASPPSTWSSNYGASLRECCEHFGVDLDALEREAKADISAKKKAKGKPSQSPKPAAKAASAPAKASKNAKPLQSAKAAPKRAPVEDLRDIWLPIAGMKALSDDRRAAYNEVDAVVLGYDSASVNLAVVWEPAGLYCHAKLPYEAYLVLWDMAVVDGLNPSKSAPTEPPPPVPPPAAPPPPPSKASKKKSAPERGVNASQPHAHDLRAATGSPGVACLVVLDSNGTRVLPRPKKVSDEAWRTEVGQCLSGSSMVLVARLYSQRGECVWDSRDGEFNGKPVRRFHGLAMNDRITLDGTEVDVLHVDEGQFVWRTTEADPKQRDEGVVEWHEVEHVEGTTWRARKVEGEAPAPAAEAVVPTPAPATPVAAGPAPRIERLADDVLTVLSTMEIDGTAARITRGNLPRPLYDRVNKTLEALGGTWSKKAKAHVFADDPTDALDSVILTGEVAHARDVLGWFPTPLEMVKELLFLADENGPVKGASLLEPSAGEGAIVGSAIMLGYKVTAVEIDPGRHRTLTQRYGSDIASRLGDFLRWDTELRFDRVVMNPPFARQQDIEHVTYAFRLLAPGGRLVAVMSAGVAFREDRKTATFRELVREAGGTITENAEGAFKSSGTSVRTVTVVMDRKAVGA